MKKAFVLVVLFILPIVAYLFFASGINHFGKLPVLTEQVQDVREIDNTVTFKDKITVLGFLGADMLNKKGNTFNLNQKIYKPFYEFRDFQFVMIVPEDSQEKVAELRTDLGGLTNIEKWNFVYASPEETQELFASLDTNLSLDPQGYTPFVFIIDKEVNLRGRNDDEDEGTKYGFNAISVAELNNKMEDDVKIILAEYRMALKKNNKETEK